MSDVKKMGSEAKRAEDPGEVKVVVLSHCILNRGTRWWQEGKSLKRNRGPVSPVVGFLAERKIGAVQLPCPEFTVFGNPRPPATKDEYESLPSFRRHCENLARESAKNLKTLVTKGAVPKIRVLAVVGIERSPSCGVEYVPRTVDGEIRYVGEKGFFLGVLERELERLEMIVPFVGLDLHKPDAFCKKMDELL